MRQNSLVFITNGCELFSCSRTICASWDWMSGLIEMVATWFVYHLTVCVHQAGLEMDSIANILLTFPVINAVLLTVYRVSYVVCVACHLTGHFCCWWKCKRAASCCTLSNLLWVCEYLSALDFGYSLDQLTTFFRFEVCLSAAIGGSPKTGLNSSFLISVNLNSIRLVLGKKGLKSKGAVLLERISQLWLSYGHYSVEARVYH